MAIVTDLEAVNQVVIDLMKRHYGERLDKIVLFGSYARGDFHEDSDVDYLVLLDKENVSPFKEIAATSAVRNAYYLETFISISTVVVSSSQFAVSDQPFFREVRKDGKLIYERELSAIPA